MTLLRSQRSGFTIIEVVVAMGLLLLGMTSILGLLSFGAALSRTAQLRNSAASAAETVVADLEETLFPLVVDPETGQVVVGRPKDVVDRPVPGSDGIFYTARVSGDPRDTRSGGPMRWRVDVEMHWMTRGRERSRSFTTLLLREVPFGERLRRQFVADEEREPLNEQVPQEVKP